MASPTDWIFQRRIAGYTREDLYAMYKEFCAETGYTSSEASFKRLVRAKYWEGGGAVKNQTLAQVFKKEAEKAIPIPSPVDVCPTKESIIVMLSDYVLEVGRKLSTEDFDEISKRNNISTECFLKRKDLSELLNYVYSIDLNRLSEDIKIKKVETELKRTKLETNRLKDAFVEYSKVYDLVNEAITSFTPVETMPLSLRIGNYHEEREAILVISDVHLQEVVEPMQMMGINEYNTEIALERLAYLFERATEQCRDLGITRITVALGGDLIGGTIHEELIRSSDISAVKAIMVMSDFLATEIRELKKYFSYVSVQGVVGNHGRILAGKPYFNDYVKWNWETLILTWIKDRLEGVVDFISFPESVFCLFDVLGNKFLLTHGHTFGGGGNGYQTFPNGISKNASKLQGVIDNNSQACCDYFGVDNTKIDYFIIGHYHNAGSMLSFYRNIPVYINGSVKGADAFSLQKMSAGSKPSQKLIVVEAGVGVLYVCDIEL